MGKRSLGRIFRYAYQRVICRSCLHTRFHLYFLLPRSQHHDGAFALHARVFRGAWRQLPRPVYACIVLYSFVVWYGVYGWLQVWRYLRQPGFITAPDTGHRVQQTIPGRQYRADLWACYRLGIPLSDYHNLRLDGVPRAHWWAYLSNAVLPHWHSVLQAGVSANSSRVMADKAHFEFYLSQFDIPVIPGILWQAKDVHSREFEQFLTTTRAAFIKPVTGARGEHCYVLSRQQGEVVLLAHNMHVADVIGYQNIQNFLAAEFQQQTFLTQPKLENHARLTELTGGDRLVTLRVISCRTLNAEGQLADILIHRAKLEVPIEDSPLFKPYPVNLTAGTVTIEQGSYALPHLHTALTIVRNAHMQVSDLVTVGWDLALTPEGAVLIEGNLNWGVNGFQGKGQPPLLDNSLLEVYQQHIRHCW